MSLCSAAVGPLSHDCKFLYPVFAVSHPEGVQICYAGLILQMPGEQLFRCTVLASQGAMILLIL